jgi:hypothetical protein
MSAINAGHILHLAGNNVIDRIQSAGLGDVRLPTETIREVGNRNVVDKIVTEPDFTFTLEGLNTSPEIMAWLTGADGATGLASGEFPGAGDPDGTEYNWLDCGFVNVPSPWKDPATGSAGVVEAGHLIPGYYPTRIQYRFGTKDNAGQTVELAGGSYYYGEFAPVEERFVAGASQADYESADVTVKHRKGGSAGTTFRNVFGVLVDGDLQTEDVDYKVTGGNGAKAKVTFLEGKVPDEGAIVKLCYFTSAKKAFPDSVHASTVVVPAAVRGRNIVVELTPVGKEAAKRFAGLQSAELEATLEGEISRELGTEDITSRTVTGSDCKGTLTVRSKNKDAFFEMLEDITGVDRSEVFGWLNENSCLLDIKIQNPKNPAEILKTLRVKDAIFQVPGTPAKVNSPTDFSVGFESQDGNFSEFKGEPS